MTNNDRLAAIRAMCEERGTGYLNDKHIFHLADGLGNYCISGQNWTLTFAGDDKVQDKEPSGLDIAEALLAATAPGAPVVEIEVDDNGDCCPCGLWNYDYHNGCGANLQESYKNPGPNCPGPGTYRLVKVGDE